MKTKATSEKVQEALYQALLPVLENLWEDREAFHEIGPTLLMGAVYLLIQDIGEAYTAAMLKEMAARVERGEYANPFAPDGSPVQ